MALLTSQGEAISRSDQENPGEEFWAREDLPYQDLPDTVTTHVSSRAWKELTEEVRRAKLPGWEKKCELAEAVLYQLENGVSSGVSGKGLLPIRVENVLHDLDKDAPRMMDALFSAIKAGTIAGPLVKSARNCRRVNSFLSIPKPNGDRRQVGDLSRPDDRSFNSNVDPSLEATWPLEQVTARQFSYKLLSMGQGAVMGKSDLSQAYKCLPVTMEQRDLQNFVFGGRVFTELRLIFGDKYAPMFFDRFHHVILTAFVALDSKAPRISWDKCIDDVPIVCPSTKSEWLRQHFKAYKEVCEKLGVKLAPMDNASKCFEASQLGEVLGVCFDTENMTWHFPERKKVKLVRMLKELIGSKRKYSLREFQVIVGKLNDVKQLWRPGKWFIDTFISFMNLLLEGRKCHPNTRVKRDAHVWLACIEEGVFPILPDWSPPPLEHIRTYSDAASELLHSPGVGLLIPAQLGKRPRASAWEFPKGFLISVDEKGSKCYRKTTCLEAIGMLSILLLAPDLLQNKSVVHTIDNIASVLAWRRGRSVLDNWATTVVRATAHVCAFLNVDLHTEWQPRRFDRCTRIVDDLSHDLCASLGQEELKAYCEEELAGFPDPLLAWMNSPRIDANLGHRLVDWLKGRKYYRE